MHCSGSCETQTDRKSYLLEARCKNYPHLSNSSRSEVGARRDVDPTAAVDMVSRRRLLVGRPKKTPTEFFSGATPVSICFRWVPANLCSVNRGAPKFFFFFRGHPSIFLCPAAVRSYRGSKERTA